MIPLLYIDPGTGSILFSIVIGLITTLYFLAKTAFIKLKVIVYKDKGKAASSTSGIVLYSEGTRYWNVFAPICDEFEKHRMPLVFYTSQEDDPVFLQHYSYVKPEYIGKGNRAFARLNMLEAAVCLMTTPGLDVYQLKRSKHVKHYSHILHALDDATSYRLFGLDYFDSVLLSGEYQKKGIRELEQLRNLPQKELRVVGCPYLDVLQEKILNDVPSQNSSFTVLVAPSWGANGILAKYGTRLIDPLVKTGWNIIIRPHPQSTISEVAMLKKLEETYKDVSTIAWDYNPENIDSLSKADSMISDFSSVIFDYCFLFDKPFLYCNNEFDHRPYDSGDLKEMPWKFSVLKEIGVELHADQFENIKTIILEACQNKTLKENRKRAKDTAWQNRGHAGEAVYTFLTETAQNFSF